jgi:hypothetical protein
MVRVVKPRIGERIRDDARGSAGFFCESYDYMRNHGNAPGNPANREKGGIHLAQPTVTGSVGRLDTGASQLRRGSLV